MSALVRANARKDGCTCHQRYSSSSHNEGDGEGKGGRYKGADTVDDDCDDADGWSCECGSD